MTNPWNPSAPTAADYANDNAATARRLARSLEERVEQLEARRMRIGAVEAALTDAIEQWMRVPTEHMQYAHGNAQGIARALALLRATTFAEEWSAGLDRYQQRVVET